MPSIKLKQSYFLFLIYYTMFIVALFIGDIKVNSDACNIIAKEIKLFVVIFSIFTLTCYNWNKSEFKYLVFSVLFGLFVLFMTGDFFWLIVILLSYAARKIEPNFFYRYTFVSVLVLTSIVVFLFFSGLIKENVHYRTDFSSSVRHSLGFVHSSVLPLNFFYLLAYYIMLKREKSNGLVLLSFGIISYILFVFCESRNAFYLTVLMIMSVFLLKCRWISKFASKILDFFSKHIATFCFLSILPCILRVKNLLLPFCYAYDSIFTNRSLLGAAAINSFGIKLINNMSYYEYSHTAVNVDSFEWTGVVLDNAYMYLMIRYGILILCFVWFVFRGLYKKYNGDKFACLVIVIVAIANVTDNDINSYGFLPFMLVAIVDMWSHAERGENYGTTTKNKHIAKCI